MEGPWQHFANWIYLFIQAAHLTEPPFAFCGLKKGSVYLLAQSSACTWGNRGVYIPLFLAEPKPWFPEEGNLQTISIYEKDVCFPSHILPYGSWFSPEPIGCLPPPPSAKPEFGFSVPRYSLFPWATSLCTETHCLDTPRTVRAQHLFLQQ